MRTALTNLFRSTLPVLVLLVPLSGLQAQSEAETRADAILADAMTRYHESLDGIRSIEIELLQMGMPTRMRMEVEWGESGTPRLRPVSVQAMGAEIDPEQADFPGGAGIFETPLEQLEGMYRYEGEAEINGRTAHHLSFTDPDPSGMAGEMLEERLEFLDGLGALYLDVETFDLLRMEWNGEVMHEGTPESLMMMFESEDFREEDGYRYPRLTRVVTDAARFTITDEEREMLRARVAQLEQIQGAADGQMDEMGDMARALVAQAEQLSRMVEEGVMEVELEMRNVTIQR